MVAKKKSDSTRRRDRGYEQHLLGQIAQTARLLTNAEIEGRSTARLVKQLDGLLAHADELGLLEQAAVAARHGHSEAAVAGDNEGSPMLTGGKLPRRVAKGEVKKVERRPNPRKKTVRKNAPSGAGKPTAAEKAQASRLFKKRRAAAASPADQNDLDDLKRSFLAGEVTLAEMKANAPRPNLSTADEGKTTATAEAPTPSRTPVILQHAALQIYRGLRKKEPEPKARRSRAFAIATASLQDAGVFTPGSRKLTRYGRRIEREHVREDPDVLARKLKAYERMLRAGDFDATVAARSNPSQVVKARHNPDCGCRVCEARSNPKGDILVQIRETARKAADFRLKGAMPQALHLDAELDRLYRRAEREGLGDEAVLAEEEGRQAASRTNPSTQKRDPYIVAGQELLISGRAPRGWYPSDASAQEIRRLYKQIFPRKYEALFGKSRPNPVSSGRGAVTRRIRANASEKRWINLLSDVADLGATWWHGQSDPLYAVISRYNAGRYTWDVSGTRRLIEASEDEIEALKRMAVETIRLFDQDEHAVSMLELDAAQGVLDGALDDIGEGPESRSNPRSTAPRRGRY